MLKNVSLKGIISKDLFNYLLAFIPLSFIAGNTIINTNIILIILLGFYHFKFGIFKLNFFLIDKLFFYFFLLIVITGIINDLNYILNYEEFSNWKGNLSTSIKSFAFVRYFIFYLVVRYLIEKKIISLKLFFISCSLLTIFVSLDIFFQLITGKDIFGYESIGRKFLSPSDYF